jgi:biopolymer transport protein ExbD
MRTSTRRGYRNIVEDDLELMPLMNLFVAMIPMLLISAVFLNVTVIDMKTPADPSQANNNKKNENLLLAITIKPDYYVIEGRGVDKQVIVRKDPDAPQKLSEALAGVVAAHPDNQDVMIISQPDTHYEDIIAVMDISRQRGLPGVALMGAGQ